MNMNTLQKTKKQILCLLLSSLVSLPLTYHCANVKGKAFGGENAPPASPPVEPVGADVTTPIYFWVTGCGTLGNMMGGTCAGTETGLTGADNICSDRVAMDAASLPERSEPYTHTAMLRRGVDAEANHPLNLPISNKAEREVQRPDGTPITNNYDDFWDPMVTAAHSVSASSSDGYYTAILPSGAVSHLGHCDTWTFIATGPGDDIHNPYKGSAGEIDQLRFTGSTGVCRPTADDIYLLCASY